ncbi:MAG: GNAT family N-acetyltransferase [Candidatus Sumerlaeia bacterium]|nr:GNAT family N-acetyltransferase [Candidatus Sumerlaeia bacterium]
MSEVAPAAGECSVIGFHWSDPRATDARRIRFAVFVDEQWVPAWTELDVDDARSWHVLALDAQGSAWGTGRLVPDDQPGSAHIGRIAVLPAARGLGLGRRIVEALLTEARRRGFHQVVLSAQLHVVTFYEQFGFQAEGPVYFDVAIPHRTMRLPLT